MAANEIAKLGYQVDSNGLLVADRRLKNTMESSKRTESGIKELDKSFIGLKGAVGVAVAALATFGVSLNVKDTIFSFNQAMTGLRATTRATTEEMAAFEKQARALGATSMFSATQAAEAQRFLAMAGFNTNEILSSTPQILKLATAAEIGLAQAADLASNALGGLQLPVDQLGRVMDVMSEAAASANTDIVQLASALRRAAPIGTAAGVELEELTAVIGSLSDAGLQAELAGTGVVGIIRQLSNITPAAAKALDKYGISVKQMDISTHGLTGVMGTLRDANISAGDAIQIFGSEAAAAGLIIANYSDHVAAMTERYKDSAGAASEMAKIMEGSLPAAALGLGSAFAEMALQAGDAGLTGAMKQALLAATGLTHTFTGMLPEFAAANDLSAEYVNTLMGLGDILSAVGGGIAGVTALMFASKVAAGGLSVAMGALNLVMNANPYVLAATAIAAVSGAIWGARNAIIEWGGESLKVRDIVSGSFGLISASALDMYESIKSVFFGTADAGEQTGSSLIGSFSGAFGIAFDLAKGFVNKTIALLHTIANTATIVGNAWITAFKSTFQSLANLGVAFWKDFTGIFSGEFGLGNMSKAINNALLEPFGSMLNEISSAANENWNFDYIGKSAEFVAGKVDKVSASFLDASIKARDLRVESELLSDELNGVSSSSSSVAVSVNASVNLFDDLGVSIKSTTNDYEVWLNSIRSSYPTIDELESKIADIGQAMMMGDLDWSVGQRVIDDISKQINELKKKANTLDIIGSAAGDLQSGVLAFREFGEEGTKEYKRLTRAAQSFAAAQAFATGKILTGFAQVASVLGSIGGGDLKDISAEVQATQNLNAWGDKADSISRSMQITASATEKLVGINTNMLKALQVMQQGIAKASGLIVRDSATPQVNTGALGIMDSPLMDNALGKVMFGFMDKLTFGMFGFVGKFFGGKSKVVDEGIRIVGGSMADMMEDVLVQGYQQVDYKKWRFGSKKSKTEFSNMDSSVGDQFSLVFGSIADSVYEGATMLGLSGSAVEEAINNFTIATKQISLKGLSAEQQQKEIEAYFSQIFDGLALEVVDFLPGFQKVGEGYGETLSRIATQVAVLDEVSTRFGINFGDKMANPELYAKAADNIATLTGGLEEFINKTAGFTRFADEATQIEIAQNDLNRALSEVGLSLPSSTAGMWELMQSIDGSTEAGQKQIATLLNLQDSSYAYYQMLDRQNEQYKNLSRNLRGIIESTYGLSGAAAQTSLDAAIAAAKLGDFGLALSGNFAAAMPKQSDFENFADFAFEQAVTANKLEELAKLSDGQISIEERQLSQLEQINQALRESYTPAQQSHQEKENAENIKKMSYDIEQLTRNMQRAQTTTNEHLDRIANGQIAVRVE